MMFCLKEDVNYVWPSRPRVGNLQPVELIRAAVKTAQTPVRGLLPC